jgi:phenylpyruvate tautomerase PptA (4-oxalocrotonate tautomerase family)
MPHVIVKLWPGKSEQQKQKLADGLTKVVMSSLDYGEERFCQPRRSRGRRLDRKSL